MTAEKWTGDQDEKNAHFVDQEASGVSGQPSIGPFVEDTVFTVGISINKRYIQGVITASI